MKMTLGASFTSATDTSNDCSIAWPDPAVATAVRA